MILIGSAASELRTRHFNELYNGMKYWRGDYFETPTNLPFSPQAYLVQQPPNITNPTHFHIQNQFQLFTAGSGFIGKNDIKPYTVHYAGAYTGYGPLVSSESGLHYITLRSLRDPGAKFIPEKRAELINGPKHHFTSEPLEVLSESNLKSLQNPCKIDIHIDPCGLGISQLRIPANCSFKIDFLNNSTSAFLVVLGGTIIQNEHALGVHENIFLSNEHEPITVNTTETGSDMLFLQFPPLDNAYRN